MVAPTSFFKDYGGHIRILEEATTLQASGHSITIVTYNMGDDLPDLTIRRTWSLPYRADYEVGSSRHKASFDLYLLAKTIQVGLQLRPDIVHGHMHEGALIGGILARLLRVPLVFDFQGSLSGEMVDHGFLNPQTFAFRFMKRIERAISGKKEIAGRAMQTDRAYTTKLLGQTDDTLKQNIEVMKMDLQKSAEKGSLEFQTKLQGFIRENSKGYGKRLDEIRREISKCE